MLLMATPLDPSPSDDVPPVSVELDAIGVLVEAWIVVAGHEQGQRWLSEAARILALREEAETVIEFLPPKQLEARRALRRQTAAWFRRSLSRWISRL